MGFLNKLFVKKDHTSDQPKKEKKLSPAEIIDQLFSEKKIDPMANRILAIAILYERKPSPTVWVGPGPNPYDVGREDNETQQLRMLLIKILPNWQPSMIPNHLRIEPQTLITGRQFKIGESTNNSDVCPLLAQMLVEALRKYSMLKLLDPKSCSAMAISATSFVTGEVRVGVLIKK